MESQNIIRCTPVVEELLPNVQIKCHQSDCSSVFANKGNLEMHLVKHHKIATKLLPKDKGQTFYHCPTSCCAYNEITGTGQHFKSFKYLRQHYQKVHAEKKFLCSKCPKTFISGGMLNAHIVNCGRKYICAECSWSYDSQDKLVTHGKRKGHNIKNKAMKTDKVAIPRLKTIAKFTTGSDQQTQTDHDNEPEKRMKISSVQPDSQIASMFTTTTSESDQKYSNQVDETPFDRLVRVGDAMLCDIETQTEMDPKTAVILDQMLYSNMHTQTCDEFLSELGLSDIQTQTNWSTISPPDNTKERFAGRGGAHDELLVSTETQTSFSQCLLESCNEENSFGGCTLTQHTQTCETLLEGLFGAQENDLIGNFQSTHTQT